MCVWGVTAHLVVRWKISKKKRSFFVDEMTNCDLLKHMTYFMCVSPVAPSLLCEWLLLVLRARASYHLNLLNVDHFTVIIMQYIAWLSLQSNCSENCTKTFTVCVSILYIISVSLSPRFDFFFYFTPFLLPHAVSQIIRSKNANIIGCFLAGVFLSLVRCRPMRLQLFNHNFCNICERVIKHPKIRLPCTMCRFHHLNGP